MELSSNCKKSSGQRGDSFYYVNISKNLNKQKKMPVCKECIAEIMRDFMKFDKEKAIEQAMMLFPFLDVAYIHDVFMSSDDIGVYFRTININYRDNLAWKDSIFPDDDKLEELIEVDTEIRDEWVERWGEGFAITDYMFLENEFRRLCDAFELDDYGKEIIFKQIAYTQLDLLYATKNKLPKDKLVKQLQVISYSEISGVHIISDMDCRQFFVTGHSEYDRDTLAKEYFRDKEKGLDIDVPYNYFPNDDDKSVPIMSWKSSANIIFSNWLNYFVYQKTPYDLAQL